MTAIQENKPKFVQTSFRAVMIAGPTASGKSALALQIAKAFNGNIINADSMQVYRELQILSARPSKAEMAGITHYLYGHKSAQETYSTGQWVDEALVAIAEIEAGGYLPIFVGGTGLYFRALMQGLAHIPDISDAIRDTLRQRLAKEGSELMYTELLDFDPQAHQRFEPTDGQRILRAHEVYRMTGRCLSDWQQDSVSPPFTGNFAQILLMPDRAWLYRRCDLRFEEMLERGALQEAKRLQTLDIGDDMPATKALGLSEILALQSGVLDLAKARAMAQQRTRRYAKRQMTWFRNQMISWNIYNEQEYYKNQQKIFSYVAK